MSLRTRSVASSFVSMISLLLTFSPALADDGCAPVNTAITTSFAACETVCTRGTLTGLGTLHQATTFFVLSGASENPSNPPGCVIPGGLWCITDYTGVLQIEANAGSLTLTDAGTVNFLTGAFSETDTIVSGTGAFAGTHGVIPISGTLTPDGSGFVGQLSGSICHARNE